MRSREDTRTTGGGGQQHEEEDTRRTKGREKTTAREGTPTSAHQRFGFVFVSLENSNHLLLYRTATGTNSEPFCVFGSVKRGRPTKTVARFGRQKTMR